MNLIYHSFLRENYKDIDWERELNLEKKIRFMSFLCNGFEPEPIDPKLPVLVKYGELRSFRNQIFHSNIEDALKSICVIEDGFYYNYDMKDMKPESLPISRIFLDKNHVLSAKTTVDDVISLIVGSMKPKFKSLVDRFIFKTQGESVPTEPKKEIHIFCPKNKLHLPGIGCKIVWENGVPVDPISLNSVPFMRIGVHFEELAHHEKDLLGIILEECEEVRQQAP